MKRFVAWALGAGVAVAVAIAAGLAWNAQRAKTVRYVTAAVDRGAVMRTITASGSVNPEVTVQVGAFVSGTINALHCDYNTVVKKGQVCATIDPRPYQLTVAQDRAALESAKAQLVKDRAGLEYAGIVYERAAKLLSQDSISRDAVDNARSLRDQAQGQVALDQATIKQRQAALDGAVVNLGYTSIISPLDGVVVSRNVTVVQTVASSFQTPTLFLIAKDLTRMQVDTNVSESDVGAAAAGAPATFTVQAYPGRVFRGRVTQVRQAPISVQNVITYDVVIAAENPDLLLRPGMTATAQIVVAQRKDVLRAPSQALHYTPPTAKAGPAARGGGRRGTAAQQVWMLKDGKPVRVPVSTGLDDDANVEITGGALQAGDAVIVSGSGPSARARPTTTAGAAPLRLGR
ncbi:MAG: efflux RND transporter periplasmic adaptor subunit [Caulobacteraceae bacterium]